MSGKIAAVAAVILQGLVMVFMYIPAGLVVPGLAWLLLVVVGLGLTVVCLRLARGGAVKALALPVVSAVVWIAYVAAGSAIFDWRP